MDGIWYNNTAIDLYQAIEGNFKLDGKTYRYIYDYVDRKLYTDQHYEKFCHLKEVEDGFYVGYKYDGTPDFEDYYIFDVEFITDKEIHYGGYYWKLSGAHGTYSFEAK